MADYRDNRQSSLEGGEKKKKSSKNESQGKTFRLIFSIVLAIVFWAIVVSTENPTTQMTITDVPITYTNEDQLNGNGLAVTGERQMNANIVIEGKSVELIGFKRSSVEITANLGSCQQGENKITLAVDLPYGVKLTEDEPVITVQVEERVSETRKIAADYSGSLPSGYALTNVVINPDEVVISGPVSEVENVDYITAPIDRSTLSTSGSSVKVDLIPHLKDDSIYSQNVILSANQAAVRYSIQKQKTVPLNVTVTGQPDQGCTLTDQSIPKTITIQGHQADVDPVTSVECKPVDISGINSTTTITLEPILPEYVYAADSSAELKAVFTVEPAAEKTFTIDTGKITFSNAPEGMSVTPAEGSVSVTVSGDSDVIKALKESDFTINADCSGITADTASLPITVECSARTQNLKYTPQTVAVSVTAAATGAGDSASASDAADTAKAES